MNKCLLAIMIVTIFSPFSAAAARAAQGGGDLPVHLSAAMDLALKERPEQHKAAEEENIARSKVREVKGNFLPTLDLSATSDYINNFDTFSGINISAQIAGQDVAVNIEKEVPAYELIGQVDLVYNLYAGGRDGALLHEALQNLEAAVHRGAVCRQKIRLEVANAYWGLKTAQVKYSMAKRALELVRLQMRVAQTKRRVHRASDVEYENALLSGREKQVGLKTADRQCLKAFGDYVLVLGLPDDIAVPSCEQMPELADDPGGRTNPGTEPPAHPAILQLRSDLQAAAERKRAANAGNRPKLDFFAKYALIGRDSDAYLDSWRDAQSEYYMFGLKVTMNLFNGMRTRERIRQAETDRRIKQLELMEKERALAQEQRARQTALETARDQLELARAREKVKLLQEQTAAAGYRSGRISLLEYRQKAAEAENAADEASLARIDVATALNALELIVLE